MKKEFVFRFVLALCIFFLVYQFGFKPLLGIGQKSSGNDAAWAKGLTSAGQAGYDVIVLGEDPDGIAAAVSAARLGAKTLLLAQGKDLGGSVESCVLASLDAPVGQNNKLLNGGILAEMYKKLGSEFSVGKYLETAGGLVKSEKTLEVVFDVRFDSATFEGGRLSGVNAFTGSGARIFKGRFFIDATRDGRLLDACKVPYITGSGDLNLSGSFLPAMLNFEMRGPIVTDIKKLVRSDNAEFLKGLSDYHALDPKSHIGSLKVFFTGEKEVVIQGLEIAGADPNNERLSEQAYKTAVKEAENLADFLSGKFVQFKSWKFSRAAESFFFRENRHYSGLFQLSVMNILEDKYFDDTIAMGSHPVQTGKFADDGSYFAGKPNQYGIPLGCLVPSEPGNLLMTGSKASYSSLAASSAGAIGTGIVEGEAAGVTAVYSLIRNADPSAIIKDREMIKELRGFLARQKMSLPLLKFDNKNGDNWSFPALRQLLTLGLVAGGMENDYRFEAEATQKDLAIILLNGVYRLDKNKYSLELDSKIRPYFTDKILGRDIAARMLLELYGGNPDVSSAYDAACEKGYINDVMQLRLKDNRFLNMEDVYYLGAYNIKLFTGKDIKS